MATFDIRGLRAKALEDGEGCEVLEESNRGSVRLGLRILPQGREELFLEPLLIVENCDGRILDWLAMSGYTMACAEGGWMAFEKRISEGSLPSEYATLHAAVSRIPSMRIGRESP